MLISARSLLAVMLLAMMCGPSFSQDIEARFAQYQFQNAQVNEGMSVLIEKVSVTDGLEKVGDINFSAPPTYRLELSSKRTLQRLVVSAKGVRKRLDGLSYSLLGDSDISSADRESQLIHENVGWYHFQTRNAPYKGITRFQIKAGVVPMTTETRWKHPFDIATTQAAGLLGDEESLLMGVSHKTIEEEILKDGRTRLTVFNDRGGVYRMTFNKDEDWFTEEIEFLRKKMTREEEIAAAYAKRGPVIVTKEMLPKYSTYAINRTEWKEVAKNRWVPWVTRISTKLSDSDVEYEIRFRDWKFKGDFDESLLDEAYFTPEKIAASIDFKAIRDLFDRTK